MKIYSLILDKVEDEETEIVLRWHSMLSAIKCLRKPSAKLKKAANNGKGGMLAVYGLEVFGDEHVFYNLGVEDERLAIAAISLDEKEHQDLVFLFKKAFPFSTFKLDFKDCLK